MGTNLAMYRLCNAIAWWALVGVLSDLVAVLSNPCRPGTASYALPVALKRPTFQRGFQPFKILFFSVKLTPTLGAVNFANNIRFLLNIVISISIYRPALLLALIFYA